MTEKRRRAIERLLLALLSGIFIYFSHFRDGVFIYRFHPAEGGVWIDEAARVLQGEVMYRDFFEFLTPGIVYLNAALLWLFGLRVEVMARAAVATGALLAAALHALACRAVPSLWRLLPPVGFVVLVYAGASIDSHKWPELLWVQRETQPGQQVFLLPAKGGLYFLSQTRDPTSFPYILQYQNPPEQLARLVAEIERARPALGVWERKPGLSHLYQTLLANCEPVQELDNGNVLLRRRPLRARSGGVSNRPLVKARPPANVGCAE